VEAEPRQLAVGDLHRVLVDRARQPVVVLEAGLGPRYQVGYGLHERLFGGLDRRWGGQRLLLELWWPAQAGGEGGEYWCRYSAAVELLIRWLHGREKGLRLEHGRLHWPSKARCVLERRRWTAGSDDAYGVVRIVHCNVNVRDCIREDRQ